MGGCQLFAWLLAISWPPICLDLLSGSADDLDIVSVVHRFDLEQSKEISEKLVVVVS
jgi:hypothetical protein